jgi:hypothetical protein
MLRGNKSNARAKLEGNQIIDVINDSMHMMRDRMAQEL